MGFWAVVCFILAVVAFQGGNMIVALTLGGAGLMLAYFWSTKEERARQCYEAAQRENTIRAGRQRFGNSAFVAQVISDFRVRNWNDLDYRRGGCQILEDKIETPYRTYIYIQYGLGKLDQEGREQLAYYLGEAYGGCYSFTPIEKLAGGRSNSYSGYISSDGDVRISSDSTRDFVNIGSKLYSDASVPPPPPKGRNW